MKTEQLIVQYLYANKKVILQDIGAFSITADINIPEDSDKDIALPADTIQFEYNPKAPVDDGLVAFIMESTRKIKPLAYSDLESFIILNKQFLNIGKPMVFEGLGTLQKTQEGFYAFTQANTSHVMHEELPKIITEKLKEKVSFATPKKEKNTSNSKLVLGGLLAAVLIGAVLIVFYLVKNNENNTLQTNTSNTTDTTMAVTRADDTPPALTAMPVKTTGLPVKDSNNFYIVIKEFNNKDKALESVERLTGYGNKVELYTKDSATFKIRMPFKTPLTDTLRSKDSIAKFFKANTYVELP